MKTITEITNPQDLKVLYEAGAYVVEDCGDRPLGYFLEHYGDEGADGYVFYGELLYKVCGIPEGSSLPKDRIYLVVVPSKEVYREHTLTSLAELIWRYSNSTGINLLSE